MEIFKDGLLKIEFLNEDYRGLVGWDCDVTENGEELEDGGGKLISVSEDHCQFDRDSDMACSYDLRIREFEPKDIPVGELVWKCGKDSFNWRLVVHTEIKVPMNQYLERNPYIVPFLIAKTVKEAEKLKEWWK